MKKYLYLIFLLLFLLGCAPSLETVPTKISLPDPSEADPNGILMLALAGEPTILNPILHADTASGSIVGLIFNGLIKINEKLEVVPDLARSWKVSSDGRTWTFFLREDVFWHDGVPFTAEDVKFTFDKILDPKVNSVRRSDYLIEGVPIRFQVVDNHILKVFLAKPFAPFLLNMGMGILPKHLLHGKDLNRAAFNRHPVGTGPFIFQEWVTQERVVLKRNPSYYLGKPRLKKILFKILPDANTRLMALEAGEIDQAGVPAKDYQRLKRLKRLNIFEYDGLNYTYLGFNLKRQIFADEKVRQALAYATNKEQLIGLIFRGLASPAYSPSAPISWAYNPHVEKYEYNLKKARQLLAGKNLEFTILTNLGNKEREKAAVILQQQYQKLGVKVKVRVMEWSALLKIINNPQGPKDFDAILIAWSLSLDPDDYSIWHSSQYPQGLNFIGFHDPEVDRLLELGRLTLKKEKRKKIYAQIQKIIAEKQPYVFLWYPKVVVAVNERVGGLSKPGPAGLFLNMEKIFVTKRRD